MSFPLVRILLTFFSILFFCPPIFGKGAKKPTPEAISYLVLEYPSQKVLLQYNPDKIVFPASTTKTLTLYILFEKIKQGKIKLTDRMKVSKHAADQRPAKIWLQAGNTISVRDAILAVIVKSANDAAVTIAEHIGGTHEKFARMMNEKAKFLGMKNTHFKNSTGWHHDKHTSTARDMAKLSHALIRDFGDFYKKFFATKSFKYGKTTYQNWNRMLGNFEGIDGIKTGATGLPGRRSGYCFLSSAVRQGKRIIGVLMGAPSSAARFKKMGHLLEEGFKKMKVSSSKATSPKLKSAPQKTKTLPKPTAMTIQAAPLELSLEELLGEVLEDELDDEVMAFLEDLKKETSPKVPIQKLTPGPSAQVLVPPPGMAKKKISSSGKLVSPSSRKASSPKPKFRVRVGSFQTLAAAKNQVALVQKKFPALLKGKEAQYPHKGKWYYAEFPGITDVNVCAVLKKGKVPCARF